MKDVKAQVFNDKFTKLIMGGFTDAFVEKLEEIRQDNLAILIDSPEGSVQEREAKGMVRAINKIYEIPTELLFVEKDEE